MRTAVKLITTLLSLCSVVFAFYIHYRMLDVRPSIENTFLVGCMWSLGFCFFMYLGVSVIPRIAGKIFPQYL